MSELVSSLTSHLTQTGKYTHSKNNIQLHTYLYKTVVQKV